MGSRSNTEAKTEYVTTTTNANIQDNEGMAFGVIADSDVNVTATDHDTVARAFDFAGGAGTQALQFAQRAGENAMKFAYDAGRPDAANTRTLMYVGGGVLGVFALVNVMKRKRK